MTPEFAPPVAKAMPLVVATGFPPKDPTVTLPPVKLAPVPLTGPSWFTSKEIGELAAEVEASKPFEVALLEELKLRPWNDGAAPAPTWSMLMSSELLATLVEIWTPLRSLPEFGPFWTSVLSKLKMFDVALSVSVLP